RGGSESQYWWLSKSQIFNQEESGELREVHCYSYHLYFRTVITVGKNARNVVAESLERFCFSTIKSANMRN
ncbi:hypothetical protein, partial [Glutamicibacter arilaitensis]|uniref:hypothetical protein n=1 Tax=Glutamicibacter arilaitensis TaxID=256701 RepID=UPI003F93CF09